MISSFALARRFAAARSCTVFLPLFLLAACEPGQLKEGLAPDDAEVAVVEVTPESAAVTVGQVVVVRASAQTNSGQPAPVEIDWSSDGGTLTGVTDSTAQFSAALAGSYWIRGRHRRNRHPEDSTTITVTNPTPVLQAVILTPSSAALATGATQQFSVSGQWSNGATTAPAVIFNATGGTITSGGLYTAGSSAGTFRVVATHQGGTLADTAVITLTATPPVLQAVILTPSSAALATGATQQFSVSGQWSNGATTAPAVTYSATGGTVTSGGLYTAGSTAGSFRVIAVQQGGTLADTAVITLTATPPVLQAVILTPSSAALATGATQQFSVSGQWSNGAITAPAVTYSATGGTVSTGGLYTAGSTAGTFRVIATQQGGTLADTSTVTLTATPPVLQAVILTPSSAALGTGATQQFSVSGQWSNGATTAPAVTYSATGGTVSTGGLYTAGSTAGSFRVIAVQQGGTLADTAVITLTAAPPVLQAVILTPASASLTTGATRQFSVSGQWSNGATTAPAVTYSATGGTVTSGGLYTAGSTAGSFRVIAVQQGGTLADTAVITLTATPPVLQAVILTPSSAALATGATRQFSVSGQWSNGATTAPAVTYSATGGTISSGGLYTAGSTAGSFRVIAVQQGGTLADTSTVTLTTPSGVTPWLIEDFSGYASTTALRSASWVDDVDTRWSATSGMSLDTTQGFGTSGRSMKASFAVGDDGQPGQTINMRLPAPTTDYWTEIWAKFSTSFSSGGTCNGNNPDYKFVFWALQPNNARNEIKVGNSGPMRNLDTRYSNGPDVLFIRATNPINSGQWHRYRVHNKVTGGAGAVFSVEFWDGTNAPQLLEQTSFSLNKTSMNYIVLGANRNCLAATTMSLHWGKITLYNQDPGWGF